MNRIQGRMQQRVICLYPQKMGWMMIWIAIVSFVTCTPKKDDVCQSDAECTIQGKPYGRCELETGQCLCADNRACGVDEFCNAAGRCQANIGCLTNSDCSADQFCDVVTQHCLDNQGCSSESEETCCTLDSHCAFGSICDVVLQRCVQGCYQDGDCLIGQLCIDVDNNGISECLSGVCLQTGDCQPGEQCDANTNICHQDTRGPYCAGCSGGVASDDCGAPGNYCLVDTVGSGEFCGVKCFDDRECPNGFACNDVRIVPRGTTPVCQAPEVCAEGVCSISLTKCIVDEDCALGPPGSNCPRAHVGNCDIAEDIECSANEDCPVGDLCLKQRCDFDEGDRFNFCTCTKNSDCPTDRCVEINAQGQGRCEIAGHMCFEDLDCPNVQCVAGGCRIGRNCTPSNDRVCSDLF